jgi:hypothetical protein
MTKENKKGVDLVFSFDTTGSMYSCLAQLRRNVQSSVRKLFQEIPNLRIGVIAHGDYCDAHAGSYVTKILDLTSDENKICTFVGTVKETNGGDAPECYELVLHEARSVGWTAGKTKAFVLIGDDVPHSPSDRQNSQKLNWRNEIDCLQEMGVSVYGVQALNRRHATDFYREIAEKTGGFHLMLDQFSYVTELLLAVAYKQEGDVILERYEQEVEKSGKMNRNLDDTFRKLLSKPARDSKGRFAKVSVDAVDPGRFQVLRVTEDQPIAEFVYDNGARFRLGHGFYEFTKRVLVQHHKEIVLMDNRTGDMFSGERARQMVILCSFRAHLQIGS